VNRVREVFVNSSLDTRIEEALPILAKIQEENMKEADIFEQWADRITEGTWALPDSQEQMTKLKELMSEPLQCGPDGEYATEQLYDLIGDDELFDDIYVLSQKDPNADCRDLVKARLADFDIVIDESVSEGAMSDLHQHIGEMIADGDSNEEIKKMHPGINDKDINDIRRQMEESVNEDPTQEEPAQTGNYQSQQAAAATGKADSLKMGLGGDNDLDEANNISNSEEQNGIKQTDESKSQGDAWYKEQRAKEAYEKANPGKSWKDLPYGYKEDWRKKTESVESGEMVEAVGDSAEAFYQLQDEFAGSECPSHAHRALIDELIRYLSGDQIADFVADFRRHYDMNDTEESVEEANNISNSEEQDLDDEDMTEVIDIDTGKTALKAERDPMLETELDRLLQLARG